MTEKICLPWIDKNERRPDEGEMIICVDSNSDKGIDIGKYYQEYDDAFDNNEYAIEFTHWVPESWFELPKTEEI